MKMRKEIAEPPKKDPRLRPKLYAPVNLKKDAEYSLNFKPGQVFLARVKPNLALYNRDHGPKISDAMLKLVGEKDLFWTIRVEETNVFRLRGFGYNWLDEWLCDYELLYEMSR